MLKGRVVLDTNIIISFLLTRGKTISSIFDAWDKGTFELLLSEEILKEIELVLEYGKIKEVINPWEKEALLEKLKLQGVLIKVKTKPKTLPDQRVINTLYAQSMVGQILSSPRTSIF